LAGRLSWAITTIQVNSSCIPPGSLNRVPASAGVKAGKFTVAVLQVTLRDPIWHVTANFLITIRSAIIRFTYLLGHFVDMPVYSGALPRLQSWGPISWSGVLLPFYRKIRQVYPVWCSRLHNHTLFIKKLCKNLGVRPNFWGVRTPLRPPNGCAHGCTFSTNVNVAYCVVHVRNTLTKFTYIFTFVYTKQRLYKTTDK